MKYKAVLLDADDTIFDFKASERSAFCRTAEHFGFSPELYPHYHRINDGLWKALERKEITKDRLRVKRFEDLAAEAGIIYDAAEVNIYYGERLSEGFFLMEGATELLDALKGKMAIYLCTNGVAAVQRSRIRGTGIEKYLDGVFISEEVGAEKPSATYYDGIFREIPYDKSEVIALGDSPSSDIKGAHDYGIHSCLFRGESHMATYRINELKEFLEVIE